MSQYRNTPEAVAALTPEQFRVTQQSGTERPGTGSLLNNKDPGIYVDIVSASPSSRPRTSLNRGVAGRASPSPTRAGIERHKPWHGSH